MMTEIVGKNDLKQQLNIRLQNSTQLVPSPSTYIYDTSLIQNIQC